MSKIVKLQDKNGNDVTVRLGKYMELESDGWLSFDLSEEVDWDMIQEVDELLEDNDPEQKMFRSMTAMGDDVPHAFFINPKYAAELDRILTEKSDEDYDLEGILGWAGKSTYS